MRKGNGYLSVYVSVFPNRIEAIQTPCFEAINQSIKWCISSFFPSITPCIHASNAREEVKSRKSIPILSIIGIQIIPASPSPSYLHRFSSRC
ncbi:hypothetical protein VTL71DRAFT_14945 [Oculimacula yallundae]|uniref:Uncharacterized protein n=1 Tax=Oculimacula yallundae TaxID=86028 RepID=A0ABR4CFA9_9HELO